MEPLGLLFHDRPFGLSEPCCLVRELPEKLNRAFFPTTHCICSLLRAGVSCWVPQVEVGHRIHFHFPICSLAPRSPRQDQQPPFGVKGPCWRKENKSQLELLFFKNAYCV